MLEALADTGFDTLATFKETDGWAGSLKPSWRADAISLTADAVAAIVDYDKRNPTEYDTTTDHYDGDGT